MAGAMMQVDGIHDGRRQSPETKEISTHGGMAGAKEAKFRLPGGEVLESGELLHFAVLSGEIAAKDQLPDIVQHPAREALVSEFLVEALVVSEGPCSGG